MGQNSARVVTDNKDRLPSPDPLPAGRRLAAKDGGVIMDPIINDGIRFLLMQSPAARRADLIKQNPRTDSAGPKYGETKAIEVLWDQADLEAQVGFDADDLIVRVEWIVRFRDTLTAAAYSVRAQVALQKVCGGQPRPNNIWAQKRRLAEKTLTWAVSPNELFCLQEAQVQFGGLARRVSMFRTFNQPGAANCVPVGLEDLFN